MKIQFTLLLICTMLLSCGVKNQMDRSKQASFPIIGTWKLISGTTIEKGDTTVIDYTKKMSFIKIINDTHFAFLNHDLKKGKDSAATFSAGGGSYTLKENVYTEHLEYCNDRQWEGNDFLFTINIQNDTLIQNGVEKVDAAGINRINIEKYSRLKN